MPSHAETQYLPYSPQQMYDLVAGIERYPDFLPWCKGARILERKSEHVLLAELVVSFKYMTESYVSEVMLTPPEGGQPGHINVHMVQGPFAHLENRWVFTPMDDGGTEVDFHLDFAFRSKILETMIGGMFTQATQKMGAAFRKKADAMYGQKA